MEDIKKEAKRHKNHMGICSIICAIATIIIGLFVENGGEKAFITLIFSLVFYILYANMSQFLRNLTDVEEDVEDEKVEE